jgi:hypothetical protein
MGRQEHTVSGALAALAAACLRHTAITQTYPAYGIDDSRVADDILRSFLCTFVASSGCAICFLQVGVVPLPSAWPDQPLSPRVTVNIAQTLPHAVYNVASMRSVTAQELKNMHAPCEPLGKKTWPIQTCLVAHVQARVSQEKSSSSKTQAHITAYPNRRIVNPKSSVPDSRSAADRTLKR